MSRSVTNVLSLQVIVFFLISNLCRVLVQIYYVLKAFSKFNIIFLVLPHIFMLGCNAHIYTHTHKYAYTVQYNIS